MFPLPHDVGTPWEGVATPLTLENISFPCSMAGCGPDTIALDDAAAEAEADAEAGALCWNDSDPVFPFDDK